MTFDNRRAYLRLSLVAGVGPRTGRQLLDAFGDIHALWEEVDTHGVVGHRRVSDKLAGALRASSYEHCDHIVAQCEKHDLSILSLSDALYPQRLSGLDDAPLVLFCAGDVRALSNERMLAIVGSRKALQDDKWIARKWSKQLSSSGVCVVSGMAYGIDAAAHRGALDVSAPTVAVLGCGLLSINTLQSRQIQAISEAGGVVISEFLPGERARPEYFPRRNRVIAGITDATLVIAAAKRSGSLITANLAAGYGRDVMAVPGSVLNDAHEGCHQLIRDGVPLVDSVAEVLFHMRWDVRTEPAGNPGGVRGFSDQEDRVMQVLKQGVMHLDALSELSGLSIVELSPVLLALELQGEVVRLPGSRYALAS